MKKVIILLFVAINTSVCLGQTNAQSLNLSIWVPPNWLTGDAQLLKSNLQNYTFSPGELNKLVNDVNRSTVLGVCYKYDPKEHYGLIPTMKFYIQQNQTETFDAFFQMVKRKIEAIKPQVLDFEYIDSPKTMIIGTQKAFYASSKYNLNVKTGEKAIIRTIFLCIPLKEKYLYITMIDNPNEDCSKLYEEVVRKIKVD